MENKSSLKIALINVNKNEYLVPPFGILSIASYLVAKKIIFPNNIRIIDRTIEDPLSVIRSFKPQIVGLSCFTVAYGAALRLAKEIKKILPEAYLVIGGQHITTLPQSFSEVFDIAVIREGEETFADLVKLYLKNGRLGADIIEKVPGVAFKNNKRMVINAERPLMRPLDDLPFLNWSLLPENGYFRYYPVVVENEIRPLKRAYLFSSRGCPFSCVFCARPVFWKGLREPSPSRFAEEVFQLVKAYGIENIWLWDDMFAVSHRRIKSIITQLKRRKILGKVSFSGVSVRMDIFNEELCRLLKKMGTTDVLLGYESGNKDILGQLKNKRGLTPDFARSATLLLEKYKINIMASFILGSPGETQKEMFKTVEMMRWLMSRKNLRHLGVSICTPLPGTPLWQQAVRRGIVSEKNMDWSRIKSHVHNPEKYPSLFFKDRISERQFEEVWQEVVKVKRALWKQMKGLTNWEKGNATAEILNEIYFKKKAVQSRAISFYRAPFPEKLRKLRSLLLSVKKQETIWRDVKDILAAKKRLKSLNSGAVDFPPGDYAAD